MSDQQQQQPQPVDPFNHYLHSGYAHPVTRSWQGDSTILKSQLIYPIFVTDLVNTKTEIKTLPGNYQISVDLVCDYLEPLVAKGLRSIIVFGVLLVQESKDINGSVASSEKSPSYQAAVDVCLCAYTTHGHCGIVHEDGSINNQRSIERLAAMSLSLAEAGAHIIAPSDMMDCRIAEIKRILFAYGYGSKVSVMSYASKFASSFYGPFRDAASSGAKFGDRAAYQLPPASRSLALRAALRDVEQGADFVMVKPAGPYLDIIREVKDRVNVPMCCYQVSGEFAMLYHSAAAGVMDLRTGVMESLISLKRAGCDIFITYFTPQLLDWLPL
eukprot:gene15367-18228_t